MSNTQLYKNITDRSLLKIDSAINDQIIYNETLVSNQPLNNFTIYDVETEINLTNNLLASNSNIINTVQAINYPILSFNSIINSPLSLVSPNTIEGRFTKIDTVYRGVIRISDLFYNSSNTQQTFTIDMSPIKSDNFITEDQASGMASMQGSNIQLRGNIRAIAGTTNILIQIFSNAVNQGVLVLNMIFN